MKFPGPTLLVKSLLRAHPAASTFACTLTLAAAGTASADAQMYSNAAANTIPSPTVTQGPASLYPSPITVSGAATSLTNLTVSFVNLSHAYPDDVDVLLVGPTGLNVLLMSDCGGFHPITNLTLTFDDNAANSLPDSDQITAGTYKPTNYDANNVMDSFAAPAPTTGPYGTTLSSFAGTNPNGT